jgi:hypothetical protein
MKNIELNEVYTLKISSGEEVIGKIVGVSDGTLELSNPLSVAPNHQGMGLMPSMFTAEQDKNVMLNTNMVTMYAVTADQVRIKYIEATTGITTASKKIVLG